MDKTKAIKSILRNWREIPTGQAFELDRFRPEDAAGVAQLFYTIYGEKYPVVDYYVPEEIVRLNREGKLFTVVGRLPSGEIAGQGAYFQSSPPNKALFEFGLMLVAPEYRNSTLAFKLAMGMDRFSRTMSQAQGFFGEAVCTHLLTQKLCSRHEYFECGLEVALMPAGAYEKEGAGAQRVSCLLGARVDRDRRAALYLPECYKQEIACILEGVTLDRDIRPSSESVSQSAKTVFESEVFDFAQVVRCQVSSAGADFPDRMDELDARARRDGLAVVQTFVNLGDPGAAFAVETLRGRGFFFGGFLPIWFGSDGLFMQKLYVEPEFENINLFDEKSKRLLALIRKDYDRAVGQRAG